MIVQKLVILSDSEIIVEIDSNHMVFYKSDIGFSTERDEKYLRSDQYVLVAFILERVPGPQTVRLSRISAHRLNDIDNISWEKVNPIAGQRDDASLNPKQTESLKGYIKQPYNIPPIWLKGASPDACLNLF
jgi:hypothetical protein